MLTANENVKEKIDNNSKQLRTAVSRARNTSCWGNYESRRNLPIFLRLLNQPTLSGHNKKHKRKTLLLLSYKTEITTSQQVCTPL